MVETGTEPVEGRHGDGGGVHIRGPVAHHPLPVPGRPPGHRRLGGGSPDRAIRPGSGQGASGEQISPFAGVGDLGDRGGIGGYRVRPGGCDPPSDNLLRPVDLN